MDERDPDLPGDEVFVARGDAVEVAGDGRGKIKMALPASAQAAIHHNRLRYAELQKARLVIENQYARTRYRR